MGNLPCMGLSSSFALQFSFFELTLGPKADGAEGAHRMARGSK
jgi:hypothetical protein